VLETVGDALSRFWDQNSNEILLSVGIVVGAMIVVWLIRRSITHWHRRVVARLAGSDVHVEREKAQRFETLSGVVMAVVAVAVWFVVILTIMGVWGIPMAPFLAVGTTIGIAVGFGAQDFVRDVIAGFLILLEDQYSVGDVVTIAGVGGSVEKIRLRTTVLRDLDGNVHHVPNGQIHVASNLTSSFARYVADISISYDADIDSAMDVITDTALAMADEPRWKDSFLKEPEMLGVDELGDSAVSIRLLLTVATEKRWAVKREFLKRVKYALDEADIEIPYAYLNVVLREDQSEVRNPQSAIRKSL
jgi:small-conductance mechanosensitive channel